MMTKHLLVPVMIAAAFTGGCKKKEGASSGGGSNATTGSATVTISDAASGSASGSGSAASAAPSWTQGGDATALPTGDPIKERETAKVSMNVQKPAAPFPQDGQWSPDGIHNGPGDLSYAYKKYVTGELDHYYIVMRWLDCREPDIKKFAGKALDASESIDYAYCWAKPNGKKLGAYDRYDKDGKGNNDDRAIKVGHLFVIAHVGTAASDVAKVGDIETFIGTLPLADLEKL